ncbi:hypothetical protein PQ472_07780 [Lacticaseibacillus pabuli]|uniref:Phage protein n=1 Tax=Lacticaseibacillus pabuli TaxID=3025672 RepID=A0ABY7WNS4_9LACO|nr:hypothetical protein [Lacticaseibacillus sp. KACC 23028]WDF81824.1 hypothetical protein PQ472_07780 [Lacticaseibacillus sp. KACC 23028]
MNKQALAQLKEELLNDVDYQEQNDISIMETEAFADSLINPDADNASNAAAIAQWVNGSSLTFNCDYIRAGIYYWDAHESDELEDLITDEEATDYAAYLKENN